MADTSMEYRRHYRSDTNISFIYIEEDNKDGPTAVVGKSRPSIKRPR